MSATIADAGCPSGLAPPSDTRPGIDPRPFVRKRNEKNTLELSVSGARCAGCLGKIERAVGRLSGVEEARLNLSTGKLSVKWSGELNPTRIVETIDGLGYGAVPFDPEASEAEVDTTGRMLLRCLAVAGFASANIMLLSVGVWASGAGEMGEATRSLMHLISALIALPTAAYAGRPFFSSAYGALRNGHANMDVPISLAVFLALGVSLYEALRGGEHAYFDACVMLLFFLLIGRWLDHQLRNRARSAARDLVALQTVTSTRIDASGTAHAVAAKDIRPGDTLHLNVGDRVPVDVEILEGASDIDTSLLTGESVPEAARAGDTLRAGALNLTSALRVRAIADVSNSLVADLVRLVEAGQQSKGRYVVLAERAAKAYVPLVHSLAALTVIGWLTIGGATMREAIMAATAVLIITCPCALGLATPAVQVVATGQLFRKGILVKSGDALERLASVRHVAFDKTGTLTHGKLRWLNEDAVSGEAGAALAALARASNHPMARAIVAVSGSGPLANEVEEHAGMGLSGQVDGVPVVMGRAGFVETGDVAEDGMPSTYFRYGEAAPVRLMFQDAPRADSATTIAMLKEEGLAVSLLSGDTESAVMRVAAAVGIEDAHPRLTPQQKAQMIEALKAQVPVAMVGDGINDAPALAHATVSLSPGTAAGAAQSAADFVFQGEELGAILTARKMAVRAKSHVLQNFAFAALYNVIAAPLAMAGLVTPLIAALAMSGSSLVVTLNALRLARNGAEK